MNQLAMAILMSVAASGASDGLVNMAVFGGGSGFAAELRAQHGAQSVRPGGLGGGNPANPNGGSFSDRILPLLTMCGQTFQGEPPQEYMAGGGIELSDGSKWAMVHPSCHPDHFIIEYADGSAERWDVGCNENTKRPRMLSSTANPSTSNFPAEVAWSAATSIAPRCNVPASVNPNPPPGGGNTNSPATSSGGSSGGAGLAVGGIAVAGLLVYALSGGAPDDLSFAPQYSFSQNGGAEFFSYGGRWEYQKDNWRAHWFARQNGGENLRYGSGAEWTDGVWAASFRGETNGENANAQTSFSARKIFGNWTADAGINASAHADKFGAEYSRALFAAVKLRRKPWTFSMSANHRSRAGPFAGIKLKRDF